MESIEQQEQLRKREISEMGVEQLGSSTSYPMTGGDGPSSYAQNSWYQKAVVDAAKEKVIEAIANDLDLKSLILDSSIIIKIVDMGCSVGPNTFIAIQNIISAIEKTHQINSENSDSPLEFQVYFNDHSNNDFNALFRTIPLSRNYFAAGVPGSFHSRLFPRSSLHIVHSSYSLHWMSKVPEKVQDSESPAWNKDSIYCSGHVEEATEAYWDQYKSDMGSFLDARAQEIVPGGLMIVLIGALPNGVLGYETASGVFYDFIGSCLIDMAKMGIVSKKKVDSFNLPLYFPSPRELKEIIQRNGCFTIERMDELDHPIKNMKLSAEHLVQQIRAVIEGLITEHFGSELVDNIFNFFVAKFSENPIDFQSSKKYDNFELFVLLKRVME